MNSEMCWAGCHSLHLPRGLEEDGARLWRIRGVV